MSEIVSIRSAKAEWWGEASTFLRELADRFDAGEISECVVVFNDRAENCFASFGHFEDRWRMLGAIEYARSHINHK